MRWSRLAHVRAHATRVVVDEHARDRPRRASIEARPARSTDREIESPRQRRLPRRAPTGLKLILDRPLALLLTLDMNGAGATFVTAIFEFREEVP